MSVASPTEGSQARASCWPAWDAERALGVVKPHLDEALAIGAGVAGVPAQSALLPALRAVQAVFGCVPEDAVALLARVLNLTRADVHGVVSFYHELRREPPGHTVITLCRAEACQVAGAAAVAAALGEALSAEPGATTAQGTTVEGAYCLGLCAVAPAALVNGQPRGRLTAANAARKLIDP